MATRASRSKPLHPNSAYSIAATDIAHAHGAEYDEDRAGPRDGNNYVSFPKHGVVHKATKKVWPWDPAGNHEQEERVLVPGVFVEALFAHAPVPKPEDLSPVKFLVKCLSLEAYVAEAFTSALSCGRYARARAPSSSASLPR